MLFVAWSGCCPTESFISESCNSRIVLIGKLQLPASLMQDVDFWQKMYLKNRYSRMDWMLTVPFMMGVITSCRMILRTFYIVNYLLADAVSRSVAFFIRISCGIQRNISKVFIFRIRKKSLNCCHVPLKVSVHNILFSWHNIVAFITCYSSHAPPHTHSSMTGQKTARAAGWFCSEIGGELFRRLRVRANAAFGGFFSLHLFSPANRKKGSKTCRPQKWNINRLKKINIPVLEWFLAFLLPSVNCHIF